MHSPAEGELVVDLVFMRECEDGNFGAEAGEEAGAATTGREDGDTRIDLVGVCAGREGAE